MKSTAGSFSLPVSQLREEEQRSLKTVQDLSQNRKELVIFLLLSLVLIYLFSWFSFTLFHMCLRDNLWGLKKQDFSSAPTLLMPYCLLWQQLLKTASAAHIRCHLSLGLDLLPLKSALAKLVTSKRKDLGIWFKGDGGWGPSLGVEWKAMIFF